MDTTERCAEQMSVYKLEHRFTATLSNFFDVEAFFVTEWPKSAKSREVNGRHLTAEPSVNLF